MAALIVDLKRIQALAISAKPSKMAAFRDATVYRGGTAHGPLTYPLYVVAGVHILAIPQISNLDRNIATGCCGWSRASRLRASSCG